MITLRNIWLLFFASCIMVGCGGSEESQQEFFAESGVAQKGPLLEGSLVTINELSNKYLQNGKSYSFQTNDHLGNFDVTGVPFSSSYLLTTAEGYFRNELGGSVSPDIVYLHGLSNIDSKGSKTVNVNILTSLTKDRTLSILSQSKPPKFDVANAQSQAELLSNFYIYSYNDIFNKNTVNGVLQPSSFSSVNLSSSRMGDQILAAYSAVIMKINSLAGILNPRGGLSTFISSVENDLASDGIINSNYAITSTSTTSTIGLFCSAFKSTNFSLATSTLNLFYGTTYSKTDLSQWVDTSGCEDRVIDKYKFLSTQVIPGTESRSPSYQASADDVGKCILVSNTEQYAQSALYLNTNTSPSQTSNHNSKTGNPILVKKGDIFRLAITANYVGTYNVYLERFNPTAGSCINGSRTVGLARLMKFSISSPSATSSPVNTDSSVSSQPTAAQVHAAYITFFRRPADPSGLSYWQAYSGSVADMYATFAQQTEYSASFAGLTSAQKVNVVYQNLFGRDAEATGLLYWAGKIESGAISVASLALAVSAGSQGADKVTVESRIAAAAAFTAALDTPAKVLLYSGAVANAFVINWLSTVQTAQSLADATTPAALDSLIASLG